MIEIKEYMRILTGGGKNLLLRSAYVLIVSIACVCLLASCARANDKVSTSVSTADSQPESAVDYVIICTGPMATTYHRTDECLGLEYCSADIRVVTLEEAKRQHRRPCRYCYE